MHVLDVMTILLMYLKLTGQLDWNWVTVLAPAILIHCYWYKQYLAAVAAQRRQIQQMLKGPEDE